MEGEAVLSYELDAIYDFTQQYIQNNHLSLSPLEFARRAFVAIAETMAVDNSAMGVEDGLVIAMAMLIGAVGNKYDYWFHDKASFSRSRELYDLDRIGYRAGLAMESCRRQIDGWQDQFLWLVYDIASFMKNVMCVCPAGGAAGLSKCIDKARKI